MARNKPKRPVRLQDQRKRPESERRLRQASRLGRCVKLLHLILGRGRHSLEELADELECSPRTVHRDLAALELVGVPWYFDKEQNSYRVRSDFLFPALSLDQDELLGQAVAGTITKAPGLDIANGASAVARRLSMKADQATADILATAEDLIQVMGIRLADHSQHRDVLRTLQWALVKRKQVVGQYQSPYQDHPVQLKLHPYRLCLVNQAWYVIARPTDQAAPKTYRAARFKSLRMTDHQAAIPDNFDLRQYFGNAWGVYRGTQNYAVAIRFDKKAAPLVTETNWHPTQQVERQKDGSTILRFTVDGLEEIVHWVIGWSDRAEVLKPQELRDRVQGVLWRTLAMYGPTS